MAIELVKSSDPQFAAQAMIRNGRFPVPDETPAQIMVCHSAEDVASAVEQALHAGKRPTILSGGHCYENFVFDNPGGNVIVHVRPMNAITQDPTTKRWKIEGWRLRWRDVPRHVHPGKRDHPRRLLHFGGPGRTYRGRRIRIPDAAATASPPTGSLR